MPWFERATEFLGSREWLLLMVTVIVVAAFVFPDSKLDETARKQRKNRDKYDDRH